MSKLIDVPCEAGPPLIYYSSRTGTTVRLAASVGVPSFRIPIGWKPEQGTLLTTAPYILVVPTFKNTVKNEFVPVAVKRFLVFRDNWKNMVGVYGTGNRNFGSEFAIAGELISRKFGRPFLGGIELAGQPGEIKEIQENIKALTNWQDFS